MLKHLPPLIRTVKLVGRVAEVLLVDEVADD